jgi:glycosyltransferase involved in cell wall biosynthesis
MKRKKIMIIHHSGLIGGGSISLYYLLIALEKEFDVVCYIPDNPPSLLTFFINKGMNPKTFAFKLGKITYYSGGNNVFNLKFLYHFFNCFFQFNYWRKAIVNENPDLIIINSIVLCWMSILFKKLNIKCICFVRETMMGTPKNIVNRLIKVLLENFNLVSFISNYDLLQINLQKAKSITVYDFIVLDEFTDKIGKTLSCEKLCISAETFNVLFVGGVNNLKGIDILIKAAILLKNHNIQFVIAGELYVKPEYDSVYSLINNIIKFSRINFSSKIEKLIISEGLVNNVKFIGIRNDMSLVYSTSDILVFPMKKPHQARPVFEIGSQMKPVIISDFINIREFIVDGKNGITFNPTDPKELANAILCLKNNNQLLITLGLNNYDNTINNHIKDIVINKFINELNIILKI